VQLLVIGDPGVKLQKFRRMNRNFTTNGTCLIPEIPVPVGLIDFHSFMLPVESSLCVFVYYTNL
jgi:hypothetical protein